MDEIKTIIEFVEGRLSPKEFEQVLSKEPSFETILNDSKELPAESYIPTTTYYYIIEQDYNDPAGILNVHGALCQFLDRRKIQYKATKKYSELFGLILDVQPTYLDIDADFFKTHFLDKAPELPKAKLKKWLKERIRGLFKYVKKPPRWIQNPQWPIIEDQPLIFLGQLKVVDYFHDETQIYVFHNPKDGSCETVIQTF